MRRFAVLVGVLALVGGSLVFGLGSVAGADPTTFTNPSLNGQTGQQYSVPTGVCQVDIVAYGGGGGPRFEAPQANGGTGGGVEGTFAVQPGDALAVWVGAPGTGSNGNGSGSTVHAGGIGYNRGGNGDGAAGGGGGSSAVVLGGSPLIVAGGGGGGRVNNSPGGSDVKIGGNGGRGVANGSPGQSSAADAGAGGTLGAASQGGDFTDATDSASEGGGGAGAGGGGAGTDLGTGSFRGGPGGGGASNVFGALSSSDPGAPYPAGSWSSTPSGHSTAEPGSVTITPADPGVGCPTSTLQVRKVVKGDDAEHGFTVHVACTEEVTRSEVGANGGNPTYEVDLKFDKDGSPAPPGPQDWTVVDNLWQLERGGLGKCTATETHTGGADSVRYECAWTEGEPDNLGPVGCPGPASGPSSHPLSVRLEDLGDTGVLTVTNKFDRDHEKNHEEEEQVVTTSPPAPQAIAVAPAFTG
jgi:hypothetical protein